MDSLHSILSKRDFDEPPEVSAIKRYVQDNFRVEVSVLVRQNDIVVGVPSAALANSLRLRSPEIKRHCKLDKKLLFRIGGL